MKTIILATLILSVVLGFRLQLGSQIDLGSSPITLACSGATGPVTYQAQNLPSGVRLYNDRIELFDNSNANNGFYPIKIRANDASGASDERIILLVVRAEKGSTIESVTVSQGASNIRGSATAAAAAAPVAVELPQPDNGVSSLLDSLNVAAPAPGTGDSTTVAADAAYPTIKFPTGGNVNAPNPTVNLIASNQAARTSAIRNQITADDVRVKASFERQLNAAKALANLLSIVKQAIANKNAATEETTKRQAIYDAAVKSQRDAQAGVIKAEGDVGRVRQAIALLTGNINDVNKKIADLQAVDKDLKGQRDVLNKGVQNSQNQLNDINFGLGKNQKDTADANDAKNSKETECKSYDAEAARTKDDRDAKNGQLNDVTYRLNAAKDRVNADANAVKDLENQLAAARANLATSQKAANDLAAQQAALQAAVAEASKKIEDLSARQSRCQSEYDAIIARIQKLKDNANNLNQQKYQTEAEIKSLTEKIAGLTNEINKIPAQINDYNTQIAQFTKNLNFLRNQLPIFQRVLNDAYNVGNSANEAVRVAKQNLDAAVARYNSEKKIEEDATYNLELARTEKDEADRAVDALIRDGAGILPYAAAPAASSGTVAENGEVSIKSWSDFVLAGYGAGVKPLFIGDLKTLYPFKLPGQAANAAASAPANAVAAPAANAYASAANAAASAPANAVASAPANAVASTPANAVASTPANAVASSSECAVASPRAFSGYVVGVNANSFRVLGDGGVSYQVTYSGCTSALANKPGYSLQVGDVVVVKGVPEGSQNFRATQVACVAQ